MQTAIYITCPHLGCDARIPRAAHFCPRCGRSLVPVRNSLRRSRRGGFDLLWIGLSLSSFLIGMALMRMGVCFGFVFVGLPIASVLYNRSKTGNA